MPPFSLSEVYMSRDHELLPGDSPTLVAICTGIDRTFSIISPDDSTVDEIFPNLDKMNTMDNMLPRDFCQVMIDLHWLNTCRESLCTRSDADLEALQDFTKNHKAACETIFG